MTVLLQLARESLLPGGKIIRNLIMKILIADTFYAPVLSNIYEKENMALKSYNEQWRYLMDLFIGTADSYSEGLNKFGCEAKEVIFNCLPLQVQWAREHDLKVTDKEFSFRMRRGIIPWVERVKSNKWKYQVLLEQVKEYKPDIFYVQNVNAINGDFLKEVRAYVKIVVAQIAYPISGNELLGGYDLIISSLPNFVEHYKKSGLVSEYLKIGFDERILNRLNSLPDKYNLSFVGGFGGPHVTTRVPFLEKVAASCNINIWGYGAGFIPENSSLHTCHNGEVWGIDMFNILSASKIVLNQHASFADGYANNMRMFESTGVGSLLLTDAAINLSDFFDDNEIVDYHSVDDCIEKIEYYLAHEEERKKIAEAGQKRTLLDHTYTSRMQDLVEIIERYI